MKKGLEVDPVDAETVRLIFRLYAEGEGQSGPIGVKNVQTKQNHDPRTVIEINIPTIVPMELFEQVQRRLSINNPKVTPPRVVNGPTLLAGLAVCASCGSGMTKSGTRRRGKIYSYYSCAGCKLGGGRFARAATYRLKSLMG